MTVTLSTLIKGLSLAGQFQRTLQNAERGGKGRAREGGGVTFSTKEGYKGRACKQDNTVQIYVSDGARSLRHRLVMHQQQVVRTVINLKSVSQACTLQISVFEQVPVALSKSLAEAIRLQFPEICRH